MATASLTATATRVPCSLSTVIVLIMFSLDIQYICSSAYKLEWYPPPICNWTANYTKDSLFVRNVNAALTTLHVSNTEYTSGHSRFNISEHGQSPNQIYALLQCRGDATIDECRNCSQEAEAAVVQDCANYVGSRVWSKFCFLRYNGNYNFTGQLDFNGYNEINQHFFYNIDTVTSPDDFIAAARQLLSSLASEITSGSSINRYASNTTVDTSFRRIYALAQCCGDISLGVCKTCLSKTIDKLFEVNDSASGARGLTGNCIVQYDLESFFNDLPPPPPQGPQKSGSSKIPIILGVLGGLVILLLMLGLFATRTKLKITIFGRHTGSGHNRSEDSEVGEVLEPILNPSNDFQVFEMKTLAAATENFHANNMIGEGGFGAVYKGTTRDGIKIAVKKLTLKSMQGKVEFLNEVKLVAKIQHRNLVKLLGCCAEGAERLLVYEYLPNNSLHKILFDPNARRSLGWQERYNIIIGVTRGLLYLHEDSRLRIIHRDIKASNILLDEKLNPKIADFGLARLFGEDETHVTTKVAGTHGYMAPEYAMHGQLSIKADVYSFGILVLELMSGRKNVDFNLSSETEILLQWAWRLYKRGNIITMIDPEIIETCNDWEQALRCIHVGFLCTQAEALLRPSMSTINLMVSTKFMKLPDPTTPAFVSSGLTRTTVCDEAMDTEEDIVARTMPNGNSGYSHASM
eukprot:PITA_32571